MGFQFNLKGKSALVTGGASGMGLEITKALHAQGVKVYVLGRREEPIIKLKKELENIVPVVADISNWDDTRKALQNIVPVDLVVNNAGVFGLYPIMELTKDKFEEMMKVNVTAVLNICQVTAKAMIDNNIHGSIVNISAICTEVGCVGTTGFGVSKCGLDRLTRGLALELGPHKIRVNQVHPSIVHQDVFPESLRIPVAERMARTPLGIFPTMEETVNCVLFMLSNFAPSVTGDTLYLDGGYRHS